MCELAFFIDCHLFEYKLEIRGALHRCTTLRNGECVNIYLQTMRLLHSSDFLFLRITNAPSAKTILIIENHRQAWTDTRANIDQDPHSKIHNYKQIHPPLSLPSPFPFPLLSISTAVFHLHHPTSTHAKSQTQPTCLPPSTFIPSHPSPPLLNNVVHRPQSASSSAASEACRLPPARVPWCYIT